MRTILLFVLILTATSLPCAAQQAGAAKPMVGLVEISADLNGDGVKDRAVLLFDRESDDVDLAIYSSVDGKLQNQPSVYVADLGWTGNTEGATPEMTVDGAGSLIVVFRNEAAGRYRWRQQFIIAFRAGSYVVAGYSYVNKDTLTPDQGGACNVDFLSGEGVRNSSFRRLRTPFRPNWRRPCWPSKRCIRVEEKPSLSLPSLEASMSYPILIVLMPLAWIAVEKLIDWAYSRQDRQTIEWPG